METYRRHVFAIMILLAVSLMLMAAVTYTIDPYSLFHKQCLNPVRFYKTYEKTVRQRLHAYGLVFSWIAHDPDYEGIIMGSSRTVGISTKHVAKVLGIRKVANLSLTGSLASEQRPLVEEVLKTGRIKNVIWEIDYWFICSGKPPITHTPEYLLTHCRLDDLQYLVTPWVFIDAIDLLFNCHPGNWTTDLDTLSSPMKAFTPESFRKESSNIINKNKQIPLKTNYDPSKFVQNFPRFDEDIIAVVKSHPEVTFYLFFPVVPNLKYASTNPEWFPIFVAARRYFVEQARNMKNVRIFAFDIDRRIAGNLANFFDIDHSSGGVQDYIIGCLASGCNELRSDTIEAYERTFIERVDNFTAIYDPTTALEIMPPWLKHD